MKSIIIMPAYNEERRIGDTLEEYCSYFNELKKQKKLDSEILIVINNTKDRTEQIVKLYSKKSKNLRYLNFKKGGKGFAITEGFKYALNKKFDLIGFVDADLATPPEAFYDLIKNINEYDGIIASRWLKDSIIKAKQNFLRQLLSRGFNFLVRVLFLVNYRDTQCGAKLFKREVIKKITKDLNMTEWAFDVNLLYLCKRNNFKIIEYPTIWEDKKDSKIDIKKTPFQMFSGILRLRIINSPFGRLLSPLKFIVKFIHEKINKK